MTTFAPVRFGDTTYVTGKDQAQVEVRAKALADAESIAVYAPAQPHNNGFRAVVLTDNDDRRREADLNVSQLMQLMDIRFSPYYNKAINDEQIQAGLKPMPQWLVGQAINGYAAIQDAMGKARTITVG